MSTLVVLNNTSEQNYIIKHSDQVYASGLYIEKWIKGTLGITGYSFSRVHISRMVGHLDVGSSYPGKEEVSEGSTVRRLKRYVSWVQNVVRQFGPYL